MTTNTGVCRRRGAGRPLGVALAAAALVAGLAGPAPVAAADEGGPTILAQNDGFLPNLFGRGRGGGNDTQLRIEQLEAQVRQLTGEVERLTFELREIRARLEALESGRGTPRAERSDAPPRTAGRAGGDGGTASGGGGPVDLSRLNRGPVTEGVGTAPTRRDASAAVDFETARTLHAAGRLEEAERELRAFLKVHPNDPQAGEAAFLIGDILARRGEHREAANVFLSSYTDYPDGPKAPESLLRLGTSLRAMGEREAACSSFEELLGAYPNAPAEVRSAAEREMAATGCG